MIPRTDYLGNIGNTPYTMWLLFVAPVGRLADAMVRFVRVDLRDRCVFDRNFEIPLPFGEVEGTLVKWATGKGK